MPQNLVSAFRRIAKEKMGALGSGGKAAFGSLTVWEHPDKVGAKHSGEESITQSREFINRMLRPHPGSCMHRDAPDGFADILR